MIVIINVGNMYTLLSCYIHDMFIVSHTHCGSLTLSQRIPDWLVNNYSIAIIITSQMIYHHGGEPERAMHC